jgi:hypothetical protein
MGSRTGRLDALGRLFFGVLGTLSTLAVLGCVVGLAYDWTHWSDRESPAAIALFLVACGAFGWCALHCFSRKRTFEEALDALSEVPLAPSESQQRRSP